MCKSMKPGQTTRPEASIVRAANEEQALKIANDTPYGLAGYVTGDTVESARRVARQIRAGNVNLQGVPNAMLPTTIILDDEHRIAAWKSGPVLRGDAGRGVGTAGPLDVSPMFHNVNRGKQSLAAGAADLGEHLLVLLRRVEQNHSGRLAAVPPLAHH